MAKFDYPATTVVDHEDDYHGVRVADPYRWLEELNAPETRAWIEAQNALTYGFLEQIPEREAIRERLTELWDYAKQSTPFKRGGRYFQMRNSGLQNQDVLYVMDTPDAEGRILLDPNALSEEGTVALSAIAVSWDGRWLAYATSAAGSDWMTWRVREIETGEDLPEALDWAKFTGAAWLPDNAGFLYGRYAAPEEGQEYAAANYNQMIYYHRAGTPQSEDVLVYARPDHKEWGFEPRVTEDGRFIILHVWEGTDRRNRIFYRELHGSEAPEDLREGWVELIPELEAGYEFVGNTGAELYFLTDRAAPRGKVVAVDVSDPEEPRWRTLIPEGDDVLESVHLVHDEFVALTLHDAHHRLSRVALDGTPLGEIELPGLGALLGLSGRREDDELFYTFSSFTYPPTVYRYDFERGASEVSWAAEVDFDPERYVTEQIFVTSKDGTRVPMFIVHRRGWRRDGQNPTLLYGYGGFNIAVKPSFAASRIVWLEMGGVLAVANLRGGGEYGETWHLAGTVHAKQNVFDDFIACAEHLIDAGITSRERLAVEGRSNGGLLIGAVLTQRPDLFGAALPTVGVLDMLRFHKFTIGWAWTSDYGSSDDPEEFRTLYTYSPLHNVRSGTAYPPTLILTGDHDDRVMPAHSYKFGAALQAAQAGDAPVLLRIQTQTGHGAGKPTKLLIEERADTWAFLVKVLGMETDWVE